MRLKLKDVENFIVKYYLYHKIKVKVDYSKNSLNVVFFDKTNINYSILIWEKFSFWQNKLFNKEKTVDLIAIKLLDYLNDNFDIPLIFKLWKNCQKYDEKTVFYIWVDGDISNLSKLDLDLLSFSKVIYTNNLSWLTLLQKKLKLNNFEIKDISNIFNENFINVSEIVILYYWDDYIFWQECIKANIYLNQFFNKVFLNQYQSELLNYYSISNSNYWNLIYLWDFENNREEEINKKINSFIFDTNNYKFLFWLWNLMTKSTLIINFNRKEEFLNFIKNTEIPNNYFIETIYTTQKGYVDYIDTKDNYKIEVFDNYDKKFNKITVFIYYKIIEEFSWFKRYNQYWKDKNFYFLSSPLSNKSWFTLKTLEILKKSEYIFCETIEWVKNLLLWAGIDTHKKNFFYWDDSKNPKGIKFDKKIKINRVLKNIFFLWEDLEKLNNLLNEWKEVVFLSDWWTPCILDPWDTIKKYINLFFGDYNIIWIKWPNVISTVMLSCKFYYKNIYWTPLIYAIYPHMDILIKERFFSLDRFGDTLIIFYSFWKNISDDLQKFNDLFEVNYWLQIIWDIWTEREYNKLFDSVNPILHEEIDYIKKNLDNTVYFIKLYN